jgi:hypothetical protein
VEVDVRDHEGRLVLAHDPFTGGEPLDGFLAEYRHALIVFNVKCDGLEGPILELVRRHGVGDHFFLDVAAPTLVRLAHGGVRQIAVRYSEHEPIELALAFAGKVDWVWVDCFTRLPLTADVAGRLREHFRICLVSPELQRHGRTAIATYRRALAGMLPDAVCSDHCDDWLAT